MTLKIPNDSYVSLEEANDYHAKRISFETWDDLDESLKTRRLVTASDFLDSYYTFAGEKFDPLQPRCFPRKGQADIPQAVKCAVCELALQEDLNQNQPQMMSSVKVGPISVSYGETPSQTANRFEYVKHLLKGLLGESTGYVELLRG
ncbi:DnaT-like ssDNA-binding protein [Rodentibacter genomosp. 2]|uniref:Putative DnaT-like domain-containing protein n=1 Tax=Rodentibacter genomosp. 2 TaxID=1908266 RepID=A0A1V3JH65_9PAST|nr:DnaT-like ssDNA-binding protein [Rodentibacter genomosp. 2]OOF55767.1 hypothetical protein BKK55_07080 [Rodentibacter genomosp. 2]OOF56145.1 hypothetical protein BKK56_03950 [Rodentibacter genomosp. 2]